jgi:ribose-phosphate pyrophosphokinase
VTELTLPLTAKTADPAATLAPAVSVQERPLTASSLPIGYDKKLMLFSGRANPELSNRIAGKLNLELGGVTLKTFSNGEVYCRYEESIRGADVFIISW